METGDENSTGRTATGRRRTARTGLDLGCILKHLGSNYKQQRSNASATVSDDADSSLVVTNTESSFVDMSEQAATSASDVSISCSEKPEHPTVSSACSSPKEGTQEGNESPLGADYTRILEANSLPTSFGKRGPPQLKTPKSVKRSWKLDDSSVRRTDPKNKSWAPVEVFDICCRSEADDSMSLRSPLVFSDEADDPEPEVDKLTMSEEPSQQLLRPGMILLKKYITLNEQVVLLDLSLIIISLLKTLCW